MDWRRCGVIFTVAMVYLCLVIRDVESTKYMVGDNAGWDLNVVGWTYGKSFKEGDVLVFKYAKGTHNVVMVSEADYKSCTATPGSKIYESGNDELVLKKGKSFFICSVPTHCDFDMKIAVEAV